MKIERRLSSYQISKAFYDLFYGQKDISLREYLDNSYCDVIDFVDLNKDSIEIQYTVENKYITPIRSGKYSSVFNHCVNYSIHPEDKELFDSIVNPKNLAKQLEESPTKNFLFFHYRLKLHDGSWRWVEQAILTGEDNGFKKGIYRFYIFDIENVKDREIGVSNDEANLIKKERDITTGLLTEKPFFDRCDTLLIKNPDKKWCFVSIDIEHFKLFEEWFGRENSSYLLMEMGESLRKYIIEYSGTAGYFGHDDFALFTPYEEKYITRLFDNIRENIVSFGLSVGFMPAIGVCLLKYGVDLADAYVKASLVCDAAKKDLKKKIHHYNPSMQAESEREYHILLDFMDALKNNEVTFYIQPQCLIDQKKIVGGEALARWIKPDGTIVPPGEFIPVLEKFGFITDLDQYLWDKICAWLKYTIDKGLNVVPISVNVSSVDIYTIDIAQFFEQLITKYDIPASALKIEITESAYVDTSKVVRDLVKKLREMGFMVLMDDFGSGYSSLNMLNNLEVDVVKLDGNFLRLNESDLQKGLHILESIISMTKTIALPIIVEGIENKEQSDFIQSLGVSYVQGYYFYKPMKKEDFEQLISLRDNIDKSGFSVRKNEQIRIREFLDKHIYSDSMLNSILGPVAYYAWKDRRVDIIRYNQQFYETVDTPGFSKRLENIQRFMPSEDEEKLFEALRNAKNNPYNGATGIARFIKEDGTMSTYIMHFYYLEEVDGFSQFYGSVNNITEFVNLREQMSLISEYSSDTIIFMSKKEGGWHFEVAAHGLEELTGYPKEEFEQKINDRSLYNNLDSLTALKFQKIARESFNKLQPFSFEFDFTNKEGKLVKIYLNSDPVYKQVNNVEYIITLRKVVD